MSPNPSTESEKLDLRPFLAAGFAIKGLRSFASPDGGGYNATLTHNGVVVADLHDGGYGGVDRRELHLLRRQGALRPEPA